MRYLLLFTILTSSLSFASNPTVVMETTMGTLEIELNEEKAPVTVKNFLAYVDSKFYDNTIFHRVINGFMVQGGGFEEGLKEKKTRPSIINEGKNGLRNEEGTIAMARTGDPNSATAQFFINVNNNDSLNYPQPDGHGYAVFGKVTKGMHVVNRMKMVKTGTLGGYENVPMDAVIIKSVKRVPAISAEAPAATPAVTAPVTTPAPKAKKTKAKKKK